MQVKIDNHVLNVRQWLAVQQVSGGGGTGERVMLVAVLVVEPYEGVHIQFQGPPQNMDSRVIQQTAPVTR